MLKIMMIEQKGNVRIHSPRGRDHEKDNGNGRNITTRMRLCCMDDRDNGLVDDDIPYLISMHRSILRGSTI